MNLYDEWHSHRMAGQTTAHVQKTLSSAAVQIAMSTVGWWRLSADVDWYGRGPESSYTAVTASTGQHNWANDSVEFYVRSTSYISAKRVGSVAGTIWADLVKGE